MSLWMSSLDGAAKPDCNAVDVWMVLGLAHSDVRLTEPPQRPFYNCYKEAQTSGAAQPDVDEGEPDAGAHRLMIPLDALRNLVLLDPPNRAKTKDLDTVFDDGYTYPFSAKTVSEAMTSLHPTFAMPANFLGLPFHKSDLHTFHEVPLKWKLMIDLGLHATWPKDSYDYFRVG